MAMRYITVFIAVFALGALFAGSASAVDYKFSTSITTPDISIGSITASASDKVKEEDKFWGERDIETLKKALIKRVSVQLDKKGLRQENGARLELELVDISPNRPTMFAMSKRIGLDFNSISLGGAEVKAHLIAADGSDLGTMTYRYYDTQLDGFSDGATTWYTARRAFDKFARRLAKELAALPAS
jgi:hypothetical protein